VRDDTEAIIGDLVVNEATLTMETLSADGILGATRAELEGTIASQALLDTIMSVAGIDQDGASNLIKQVYGLPDEEPLPENLPIHFEFELERVVGP